MVSRYCPISPVAMFCRQQQRLLASTAEYHAAYPMEIGLQGPLILFQPDELSSAELDSQNISVTGNTRVVSTCGQHVKSVPDLSAQHDSFPKCVSRHHAKAYRH